METKIAKAISAAVTNILRPLVRLLLRNGIPYRTFSDIAKRVYVDVATEEFSIPGRKQSKSRVSILTGLSRKEVLRVRRLPATDDLGAGARYNRAARVVAGWVRDRQFRDDSGNPAELPFEGSAASFRKLVTTYSGDAPPGRCSTNCCEWGPYNGYRTERSGCSNGRTSRRPAKSTRSAFSASTRRT
jgi:hypothetical protein